MPAPLRLSAGIPFLHSLSLSHTLLDSSSPRVSLSLSFQRNNDTIEKPRRDNMTGTQDSRQNRLHPWPCHRPIPLHPFLFSRTPARPSFVSSFSLPFRLSRPITFDSAKFETSFHATLPLFHVGRGERKREFIEKFETPPLTIATLYLSSSSPFGAVVFSCLFFFLFLSFLFSREVGRTE